MQAILEVTKNVVSRFCAEKNWGFKRRDVAISETHYRLSGLLFVKLRERGIFRIISLGWVYSADAQRFTQAVRHGCSDDVI